ncbi:MAG: ComEC/Rec2 family competence protein, partial [Anaerolineales bacterium]
FWGRLFGWSAWQWGIVTLLAGAASLWLRRLTHWVWIFIAIVCLSVGALRIVLSQSPLEPDDLAYYNDAGEVVLIGVVADSPDVRDDYVGLVVDVDRMLLSEDEGWISVEGRLLVRVNRFETWRYGDPVWLRGAMQTPPIFEGFNYRDYLARSDIHSLMPEADAGRAGLRSGNLLLRLIYDYRTHARQTIDLIFPDPEAALMAGILLGDESAISDDVRRDFNQTGTTHIIAISGFNMTIIAGLFINLFGRWLGQRKGLLAAGIAIGVYTLLVGADAAVVRAAIMAGVSLVARRWGRQVDAMASLGAASWLMTAANPLTLWDVSFQLSYAATLGLILYAEPLAAWFVRVSSGWLGEKRAQQLSGPVGEYLLFTLAAQVTTAPIMAYYFNRVSLISLLANPIILPLQPAVMMLGGLAMMVGTVWLAVGRVLAWLAWPFPAFTIRAVRWMADFPNASLALGQVDWAAILGFYGLLFGGTLAWRWPADTGRVAAWMKSAREKFRISTTVLLVTMALVSGLVWHSWARQPDGSLHLTILNIGEGEAVLIQPPEGGAILINGGSSPMGLSNALGERLPLLQRRLSWVVVDGTRYDQIAGLADTIERFPPEQIWMAGPAAGSAYRRLMVQVRDLGLPVMAIQEGQRMILGEFTALAVVAKGPQGAAFLLTHGRLQVLLLCGVDPEMMEVGLPVESAQVILLGDGGNLAVNPPDWIRSLSPWVVLISAEAGNRRGLPSGEVLAGIEAVTILRTDIHGTIELVSDGDRLWVQVEREAP